MTSEHIAVIGDVHGHLQLALCMCARWQRELGIEFSAVLLSGDVGTFSEQSQLDNATISHARDNPCELEFLTQWSMVPPAPWLEYIFRPAPEGLGLLCPVVMVHGNHEGFAHLANVAPRRRPAEAVAMHELPEVDPGGFIRLLPSGWRTLSAGGRTIAGVGGMQAGQRRARYHPMAYIDDEAVQHLLDVGEVDVLITHQGPSGVQGDHGSPTLQMLLEARVPRLWFHGHSTPCPQITSVGGCTVVPLGDIAFPARGNNADVPGLGGWSYVLLQDGEPTVVKEAPPFWRDYRRSKWTLTRAGRLVCPDLLPFAMDGGKLP